MSILTASESYFNASVIDCHDFKILMKLKDTFVNPLLFWGELVDSSVSSSGFSTNLFERIARKFALWFR
jgi:hypothetical protein